MFKNIIVSAIAATVLFPATSPAQNSFLVPSNARWNYHAATNAPDAKWRASEFNAQHWPQARAGFGYGDGDDVTLLTNMRARFSRIQIRTAFEISDPEKVSQLYLYVNYDDGFVAYINGRPILRCNVAALNSELAAGNHEAAGFEEFPLTGIQPLLKKGRNVLAIEGFNRSVDSSDFTLHPILSLRREADLQGLESAVGGGLTLSAERVHADVEELRRRIEDQSSYIHRNKFDHQRVFDELQRPITEEISVFEFVEKLQPVIARMGDCHARVDFHSDNPRASFLPLVLADTRDGLVALKTDRSGLIDRDCPIVSEIDGVPVNRWLKVAARFVADGSRQLVRSRSLSELRRIDKMRRQLAIPTSRTTVVTLRSLDGQTIRQHTFELSRRRPPVGQVPIARTRLLNGNIGYLRIEQMDNALEKQICDHMDEFRSTDGLIIDVRDNGGGRYGLLRLMHGYLTAPESAPYVTNIAAYRKSALFEDNHLHYRPTYRERFDGWSDQQRVAIKTARQDFDPEWTPPAHLFSQWHYMVVDKTPNVGQYHYQKPVVVLCNAGSFSATDGFLSCMTDIPGVQLVGQPSGGGSGATRRFTLSESGVRISLSSMASFRPNGKLFDGNGVEVDIEMQPTINDFLGKSDTVRSKAMEMLTASDN